METENTTTKTESEVSSVSSLRWSMRFLFKVVLPLACVAGAVVIAVVLVKTGPKAERVKPPQQARQVRVETVRRENSPTTVSALGTVIAAKQITMNPEVTGLITAMAPEVIPGGLIEKGQNLISIDRRDYETAVKQQESNLARAQLALQLEKGNQVVAAQEYEMLAEIIDESEKELVLRKPYLDQAVADIASSESALAKAKLDVQRCDLTAPFNAIIQDKYVDVGAHVSQGTALLSLIGTDEFWIEVKVPVDQLKWMKVPQTGEAEGASVKVYNPSVWSEGVSRQGTVIRLLAQLEEKGRRAQLLVSVKDPLCLNCQAGPQPKLLIGSYVAVEIEGRMLESVIAVKRDYLHDGNSVWVMNEENKLEIRPVKTIFRDADFVYITDGLEEGEQLITSDISAPVTGMLLRLEGQMPPKKSSDSAEKKREKQS